MFFSAWDFIFPVIGFISVGIWVLFYMKGLKYKDFFAELDENKWRLKDVYFVGYAVNEAIHYKYHSKKDRKLRKEIEILYEAKYVDYYLRVIHSQQLTIAMTVWCFAFILYGFSQEPMICLIIGAIAVALYFYIGDASGKLIKARSEELMMDFSEVISKLALMTNAGMILREAWEVVAYGGETEVYLEMQRSLDNMNNGMSEIDAYHEFGKRCMIPEIKKFCSTVIQGVTKGNAELALMLQDQNKEVWGAKKQEVKRRGEKAATKLLFPMMIMFVGIMLMIIVPIFANLGV